MNQEFQEEIAKIRQDRAGVVNSDTFPGIKALCLKIYPNEAQFIYELLQNAGDAGATAAEFILQENALLFCHNGKRQFTIEDIKSITSIGQSTKTEEYTQAGKFRSERSAFTFIYARLLTQLAR